VIVECFMIVSTECATDAHGSPGADGVYSINTMHIREQNLHAMLYVQSIRRRTMLWNKDVTSWIIQHRLHLLA
jgi:hypothetical protein